METQFKNTPWGKKYCSYVPMVYRIEDGEVQVYGLFESRESAEAEVAVMKSSPGWEIADARCVGFGIIGDRLINNKTPVKPRKVSRKEEAEYMERVRLALGMGDT